MKAGEQKLIYTDISMEIPPGHYGQLKSQSGIALKHRINIGAGVIDSDYRGEVCILLENHDKNDFEIKVGDTRIAQLLILETSQIKVEVDDGPREGFCKIFVFTKFFEKHELCAKIIFIKFK